MLSVQALIQRNIHRARHSLPFFDPALRDLITLIPALFSEGSPSVGVYGRTGCSRTEYGLLGRYLGRKPDAVIGRLPDRISIESLIAIPRPSFAGRHFTSITLVCLARSGAPADEIAAKIDAIAGVFARNGVPLEGTVCSGALEQLLVYEIMRVGIVLGGKHPVTHPDAASESCIYIGDLPGIITESHYHGRIREWDPFGHYLNTQVAEFVNEKNYPCVITIPSASPFIIPYLHILHHYEERTDRKSIERIRGSLLALFSPFPPTADIMLDLGKKWKMGSPYTAFTELDFTDALRLRKWMVPIEKDEIPVCSWPPLERYTLDRLSLGRDRGLWYVEEAREFGHAHAWVVLVWAALAGLAGPASRIFVPREPGIKHNAGKILRGCVEAILHGADMLVPEDHLQGSIYMRDGRFFFSSDPFAILGQGNKHSVGLFEIIKKKALLDDIDLKDNAGKR